jgi:hypothetical protein
VKNGLPEKSDFTPEKGIFARKMAENAHKMAKNSWDSDSENGSNWPLQIPRKQGGTMITCCICWDNKMCLPWFFVHNLLAGMKHSYYPSRS